MRAFIEKTLAADAQDGSVRTMFGRVRPIPDIESRNPNQRGFAERTAINTPLQGTAADLIKLAMIAIDRKLAERKLKTRMVLQVHDELLFEVPDDEKDEIAALVRAEMEGVVKLNVPLVADLGIRTELARPVGWESQSPRRASNEGNGMAESSTALQKTMWS